MQQRIAIAAFFALVLAACGRDQLPRELPSTGPVDVSTKATPSAAASIYLPPSPDAAQGDRHQDGQGAGGSQGGSTDMRDATVAIQVSHQDDTGFHNFHEWAISGDIALRVLGQLSNVNKVLAWDLSGPLTGTNRYDPKPTNTADFDSEVAFANKHKADIFISMHNDGAAPSGVYAIVSPGDRDSGELAERLLTVLHHETGLPNRGVDQVRLYSLESSRNRAPIRVLLELGDNKRDRRFLEDPDDRQLMADSIASTLEDFIARTFKRDRRSGGPRYWIQPEALAAQDPRVLLARLNLGPDAKSWPEAR